MNIYKSNLKRKVSVKKFATTNNERNRLILSSLIVEVAGYKDEKCKKLEFEAIHQFYSTNQFIYKLILLDYFEIRYFFENEIV